MRNLKDKRAISLTTEVSLIAALVTAISMGMYAVLQYWRSPRHSVGSLIVEHSWHVIVLGTITYVVLYIVMHRQVVRPMRALFLKCYAITQGDLEPVQIASRIEEIQTIVGGLNMMLACLRNTQPGITADEAATCASRLRQISADPENRLTPTSQDALLEVAARIECTADSRSGDKTALGHPPWKRTLPGVALEERRQ